MTKSARSAQPKQSTLKSRKRNGRDYFYACIGQRQVGFGYDRAEAQRLFSLALAEHLNPPAEKPMQPEQPLAVRDVLLRFVQWIDLNPEKKEATREFNRSAIVGHRKSDKPTKAKRKPFVPFLEWLDKKHPQLPVNLFGPMHVHQWFKDHFEGRKLNYRIPRMRPIKAAFIDDGAAKEPVTSLAERI